MRHVLARRRLPTGVSYHIISHHVLHQLFPIAHPALQDDRFRWNRLENLLREGSKSQDFDPAQLWLLARWLLGPNAPKIREKVGGWRRSWVGSAAFAMPHTLRGAHVRVCVCV